MGLIRTMLAAGALGAAQKGHIASRYFMESPENDARIHTMFPPTLNEHMYMTDADNAADAQRIEAMHRVHTNFARGDGFMEAAGIAGMAGLAGMANRRRKGVSERRNLPHIPTRYHATRAGNPQLALYDPRDPHVLHLTQ